MPALTRQANSLQTSLDGQESLPAPESLPVMGPAPTIPATNQASNSIVKSYRGVKLNDENYMMWAFQMKVHLKSTRLWHIVELSSSHDEHENDTCFAEIVNNVEANQVMTVIECRTPAEAWHALEHSHRARTFSHVQYMKQDFTNKMFNAKEGMKKHLTDMKELALRLRLAGRDVDDSELASAILISVKDKRYEHTIAALTAGRILPPRYDEICASLLLREKELSRATPDRQEDGFSTGSRLKETRKCFNCNVFGHLSRDCRRPQKGNRRNEAKNSRYNEQRPKWQNNGKHEANMTEEYGFSAGTAQANDEQGFMICDSGATSHMTGDRRTMNNMARIDPTSVVLADGRTITATTAGSVTLRGSNGKGVDIDNVLYVPGLRHGLFSVGRACESFADSVKLTRYRCIITAAGREILTGTRNGRHYLFEIVQKHHAFNAESNVNWHNRLGHLNLRDLKRMQNENSVHGIGQDEVTYEPCRACQLQKNTVRPAPKSGNTPVMEILDRVHSDICGPFPVSATGNRYFISFIDEGSRWATIMPMRTRDEALAKFKEFKAMIEFKAIGQGKIRALRTDNAKEYCSEIFKTYLINQGIHHEYSTPYRQHQNGIAERYNRTIQDMARTMMTHADLPTTYWEEASKTAAYIRNRCTTAALNHEKTPAEVLTGTKPNFSHARVWGCRAYAMIPAELTKKMTPRSREAILVGYESGRKAYRLVDLQTRRLFVSKDVKFNENILGYGRSGGNAQECDDFEESTNDQDHTQRKPDTENDDDHVHIIENEMLQNGDENGNLHRRPDRVRAQPARFHEEFVNMIDREPVTRTEALQRSDAIEWEKAMLQEYQSLISNGTWSLTNLPKGRTAIGTKWVFKIKEDVHGNPIRHKARLVAQGFRQRPGIDFYETFAPVMSSTTLRLLLCIAANRDHEIHQMDVDTAYLNGKIDEEIYIRQPEGFVQSGNEQLVCRLHKAIYGLRQSGRAWWNTFSSFLTKIGFRQLKSDPCIFERQQNGENVTIGVYVDDLIIISKNTESINTIKGELSAQFKMKDLQDISHILGMEINRTRERREIRLSQKRYLEKMLLEFGMHDSKPVSTPMDIGRNSLNTSEDEAETAYPFRQAVGALMYAATATRPDIMAAVSNVARFCQRPTSAHVIAVKRIFRYLRGTIEHGLTLGGIAPATLTCYADADWGNDLDDRRSTTGFLCLYGGPIAWKTKRQQTVALSTMEAEYMALAAATQEVLWLRNFLTEVGCTPSMATTIYQDNQGTIALANNVMTSRRAKHIDIRHHFTRERIATGDIKLMYCPTERMVADMLTKALGSTAFTRLRDMLPSGSVGDASTFSTAVSHGLGGQ